MKFIRSLLIIICLLGIALRISEYLLNRSLWVDEASLALNIIQKSIWELTLPLNHDQVAPLGFLMFTKIATILVGDNEYALRFLPLLAGIGACVVFLKLMILISNNFIQLFAMILFACSPTLIHYSSEFKPYMLDLFFTVVIFYLASKYLITGFQKNILYQLLFIGYIAPFFSFPSVLVITSTALVMLVRSFQEERMIGVLRLSSVFLIWGIAFSAYYYLFIDKVNDNNSLSIYWSSHFMPLNGHWVTVLFWLIVKIVDFIKGVGGITYDLIGFICALVGIFSIFHNNRHLFYFFLAQFLLLLVASALKFYPFGDRLILFNVPILYICIAYGVLAFIRKNFLLKTLGILFSVLLFLDFFSFQKPFFLIEREQEIKPILRIVTKNFTDGDTICIYRTAQRAYSYYKNKYFLSENLAEFNFSSLEGDELLNKILKIEKDKRFWILITSSHYLERDQYLEKKLIKRIEQHALKIQKIRDKNSVGYLFVRRN